jgi:hypothetical protein
MEVTDRERIGLGAASGLQISLLDYTKKIAASNAEIAASAARTEKHMSEGEW